MAKKYYAVRQGKVPGVYGTWEECKAQVHGYSGAVYKSFPTAEEAMMYVTGQVGKGNCSDSSHWRPEGNGSQGQQGSETGSSRLAQQGMAVEQDDKGNPGGQLVQNEAKKAMGTLDAGITGAAGQLTAYVDGSYHSATKEFSYGVVILQNGSEYCFNEKLSDPELASMRNVAGEIKGAEAAMRYAVEHGYRQITIYHDYEGIARWCTGDWRANKSGTKAYKAYYDSISDRLQIRFEKVKGHSGDKYNDMADSLAKQALGI